MVEIKEDFYEKISESNDGMRLEYKERRPYAYIPGGPRIWTRQEFAEAVKNPGFNWNRNWVIDTSDGLPIPGRERKIQDFDKEYDFEVDGQMVHFGTIFIEKNGTWETYAIIDAVRKKISAFDFYGRKEEPDESYMRKMFAQQMMYNKRMRR